MCDIAKFSIFREIPRNLVISARNRENQGLPRQTAIFCIFRDISQFPVRFSSVILAGTLIRGQVDRWGSIVTNWDQSLQMGISRYKWGSIVIKVRISRYKSVDQSLQMGIIRYKWGSIVIKVRISRYKSVDQ